MNFNVDYFCAGPVDWEVSQRDAKLNMLATKLLTQNSKYYESWDKVHHHSVQLAEKYQPAGYFILLPMYLQGSHDANILLTTGSSVPSDNKDVYEIVIGSIGNTVHYIKKNGVPLATNNESGILRLGKPTRIVIQITNGKRVHIFSIIAIKKWIETYIFIDFIWTDGVIQVFTDSNHYAPLLYAFDDNPIQVKYVHFASLSRMQFFYDIDESAIVANKNKLYFSAMEEKPIAHPLIVPIAVPQNAEDICKLIIHSVQLLPVRFNSL